MGSKSRIAKHIVPILQECIDKNKVAKYAELFCGGCNIIDKIQCENRIAIDLSSPLIELFKHLQRGGELLPEVSREFYNEVRESYNKQDGIYPDYIYGNVGFLASYNGRFFDGGYAKTGIEKTKYGNRIRDYYRESSDNLLEQISKLIDVSFHCGDYRNFNDNECVIYLDPPYANTKQYGNSKNFNYDLFWDFVRKLSQDNFVFVSEENAPSDFECIWEQEVSRSIKSTDKSISTEKLFVYRGVL